jgi:hypothetical protein
MSKKTETTKFDLINPPRFSVVELQDGGYIVSQKSKKRTGATEYHINSITETKYTNIPKLPKYIKILQEVG